jgi:hypothetical protein
MQCQRCMYSVQSIAFSSKSTLFHEDREYLDRERRHRMMPVFTRSELNAQDVGIENEYADDPVPNQRRIANVKTCTYGRCEVQEDLMHGDGPDSAAPVCT